MNAGEILSALLLIIGFGLQIAGKSKKGNGKFSSKIRNLDMGCCSSENII